MAKHKLNISARHIRNSLAERWHYLNENNLGGNRYEGELDLLTGGIPSTIFPDSPLFPSENVPFSYGGYDGGIEVGFDGTWNPLKFGDLIPKLEESKSCAGEELPLGQEGFPLALCGEEVVVLPSGAKVGGLLYKYRFKVRGVEFLVHSNPLANRQAFDTVFSTRRFLFDPKKFLKFHIVLNKSTVPAFHRDCLAGGNKTLYNTQSHKIKKYKFL